MLVRETVKLIGRDQELQTLGSVFEAVRDPSSRVVLIAGEAGVGKSRLAREATAASGFTVLSARSSEAATPPYGPIADVLRGCLDRGVTVGDLPETLLRCLTLLLPEIEAEPCDEPGDALGEAIAAVLRRVAAAEPTAVWLDDLHWADEATLDLLPRMVERLAELPFLVLGTYRDDEIARDHPLRRMRAELRRGGRFEEVALGPLAPAACETLIREVFAAPPSPGLVDRILASTDGVPLYVEELSAALVESGRLRQGEHGLEIEAGDSLPVPETVRDSIVLRLAGLSAPARRQIEAAAVAGAELDLALVCQVEPGEESLDELLAGGWLTEIEPGRAAFRHALVRDAVLDEIRWLRRRKLHRRFAELLVERGARPGLIAEHWLAARDLAAARDSWIESAELSCEVAAYRDAARDARRALEVWPEGEEPGRRITVLERLAHCAQVSGQLREAAQVLREVLDSPEVAADPRRRGENLRALAEAHGLAGEWEQTIEARREAAVAFEEADLPAEAATELIALADRHAAAVQISSGLAAVERAKTLAERTKRIDLRSRARSLEGLLLAVGGYGRKGVDAVKEALDLALKHGLTEAAAEAHRRLGNAYGYTSDYRLASAAFSDALVFCRTHGNGLQRQLCLGCFAWAKYLMGDWKRAAEICEEILAGDDTTRFMRGVAFGVFGVLKAQRGQVRPARRLLELYGELTLPEESVAMELIVLEGMANVDEQEGDLERAARRHLQLLDRWSLSEDRLDATAGLCAAATFFASRDQDPEASRCVEALSQVAATGNPEGRAAFAYGLGETAMMHGSHDEAVRFFRRALTHLESLDLPLRRSHTEFRTGVAEIRGGDSKTGVESLRSAHSLARKLGARPLAARVAAALSEQGVTLSEERSPDAASRAARAGLTRRQYEVVRLIAEGHTNREIGELLFLSTRTVDMHARNLFDRLDCRTRAEAVKKAAALGLLD